ncbi:AMP-binding protein [Streptacidiphilus cavernicola]|uniref:AMP-binding protein n=1 Tax=Streptacidiphilus cavernicola TaxID=3342716 RepID=A0ABV6VZW4_9ACTN
MTRQREAPVLSPSVVRQLARLAADSPDELVLSARSSSGDWLSLTRAELGRHIDRATRELTAGTTGGKTLVSLPNSAQFFIAVLASWNAGRTPLIVPPHSTPTELATLFTGVDERQEDVHEFPDLAPADLTPADLTGSAQPADAPTAAYTAEDPVDEPAEAWYLPSGGSTGLPRLIPVAGRPIAQLSSQRILLQAMGWQPDSTQLVMGPLCHAAPFTSAMTGLLAGNHLVVVDRFTAAALRDACLRFPPTWCQTTPHQMAVIDSSDDLADAFGARLTGLMHTAAACPKDVKQAWISRLGGERVFELYGSTQMVGAVVNSGTDWLARPGTVGRPFMTQVRVVGEAGRRLPPGEVGEVFMRTGATRRLTAAETAHLRSQPGGFFSVGDLGYLDQDGFLFLTDRVDDVIIVGGANVSARETEHCLLTHPQVKEVLVVGRTHHLLGHTVHALVVPEDLGRPPAAAELRQHCAEILAAHKVPATVEFIAQFSRSRAGKIQRYRYQE